jgi:predicted transcriptional regulator
MPTGNAEPIIIADAKSIIEDCIICLYIVYEQKKRFMTKTKGLSPKQMVFQQNKWFWG